MREGCEVHTGDLTDVAQAKAAMDGCPLVIHLAAIVGGIGNFHKLPHTLTEMNNGLYNAVFRAALDLGVDRFTYVSSSMVFGRATEVPTTEAHLPDCPTPQSARHRVGEPARRGLRRRRPPGARPPVHDLPPVQRLRPGRAAGPRAGHRAHGPRRHQEGAGRAERERRQTVAAPPPPA